MIERFRFLRMPGVGVYHSVIADDANSNFVGGALDAENQHASLCSARTDTLHNTDRRQTAEA